MKVKIKKSTRHSKITGDFSENLVLYFLSKHGFECANVDHTGIDIIARNPITKEIMGISVKSRSRNEGKEGTFLSIPNDNFKKIKKACQAFDCVPYFAVIVDEGGVINVFILSMNHLLKINHKNKSSYAWKMDKKSIDKYYNDPKIIIFNLNHRIHNWWKIK
jgi:Holliday junction resolvase-like predicted endonuclease